MRGWLLAGLAMMAGSAAAETLPPAEYPPSPYPPAGLSDPIPMQDYVPDASRQQEPAGSQRSRRPAAPSKETVPAAQRRGSSTPPDLLIPPKTPVPPAVPVVPNSDAATARFKRDLMQPELDRLKQLDARGRLDPIQQRDLMQRQYNLDKLQR